MGNDAPPGPAGCIKMLLAIVTALFMGSSVGKVNALPCGPTMEIISGMSISSFVDSNNYIRLNISWINPANITEVTVENNAPCKQSFFNDYEIPTNVSEIIVPSMDLTRPADPLDHCSYNITFKQTSENKSCENYQMETYTVPDCIKHICKCTKTSPLKVSALVPLSRDLYEIKWINSNPTNSSATAINWLDVSYKKYNGSLVSVHFQNGSNSVIDLPSLQTGETYEVFISYFLAKCRYYDRVELIVPEERKFPIYNKLVILTFLSVLICIGIYLVVSRYPKLLTKLRRYIPFITSLPEEDKVELNYILYNTAPTCKEEYNAQYTPLEFILKAHEFDHFELPRNKLILGKEIGVGAFGKVFLAKAFDVGKENGWKKVAVKQLRDDAPPDEVNDFETEIKTMKQIEDNGGHQNIVKLLACVTMEQPFMMVMELVPHGDLKEYLRKLRAEWYIRRKVSQHFFPHDMKEDWLHHATNEASLLKYATVSEDNSTGSYIVPAYVPLSQRTYISKPPGYISITMENSKLKTERPPTPPSATSSQLPATPDTLVTSLDAETPRCSELEYVTYPKPALDHNELQGFALQIAQGMAFLEKIPVVHRDLAVRNILITSDRQLKISDFGMSRTGPYTCDKQKRQPLRWMAIESIEGRHFDTKSDVWSFGVVLWEIGTLGGFPYEHTPDAAVLPKLKKGERLKRPKICTGELYEVMQRCWSEDPINRPTFEQLVEILDTKRKAYVDFDKISPSYAFPPTEELIKNEVEEKT